jgi:hypothetical protein
MIKQPKKFKNWKGKGGKVLVNSRNILHKIISIHLHSYSRNNRPYCEVTGAHN